MRPEVFLFLEWDYSFHSNELTKIDIPGLDFELGTDFENKLRLAFACYSAKDGSYEPIVRDAALCTKVRPARLSYADEGLNPQVRMMLWQADSSNCIRLQLNTVDARTGQFIAFTQEGGVANSALSGSDAYSPGVEVPFSVAAVLTATEIEGFYNGVSTGKVTHGGLPNLLAAPVELFPVGIGTIEYFAAYVGNPGAAALQEILT